MKTKPVLLKIDKKLLADVDAKAKELGVSRSDFVRISMLMNIAGNDASKFRDPEMFLEGVRFAVRMLYSTEL